MKTAKYLSQLLLLVISTLSLSAQTKLTPAVQGYDIAKRRLLLESAGLSLFTRSQGTIDIDSAMLLACKANNLGITLTYNGGFYDDVDVKSEQLIDENKIKDAISLSNTLKGKKRVAMLLDLGGYYLVRPGTKPSDMNMSIFFLKKAEKESQANGFEKLYYESVSLIGKYFAQAGDYIKSNQYLSSVVSFYKRTSNRQAYAQALNTKASFLPYTDSTKLKTLEESFAIFDNLNNKIKKIELMHKIVDIHFRKFDFAFCIDGLSKTLEWQNEIGFLHTHYTQNVLSYLSNIKTDYSGFFYHSLEAVKAMESTGDTIMAAPFYTLLGSAYSHLNQMEEALVMYKKAMASTRSNDLFIHKVLIGIAEILSLLGRGKEGLKFLDEVESKYPLFNQFDRMLLERTRGWVYYKLNEFSPAEEHYKKAIAAADSIKSPQILADIIATYSSFILFYAKNGKIAQASKYMPKTLSLPLEVLDSKTQTNILLSRFLVDSAQGNYLAAITSLKLFNKVNNEQFAKDVEIKYQTSKKEQDILFLNKQSASQLTQLTQANTIKNITIGASILLIIIIALIYNQYRINRRNSREVSKKNEFLELLVEEKEWLLKEIHHRVKNNLHTITSLLESQSAYVQNDALAAIKDSQHRVHTMSLIHQKLYQNENLTSINISAYIHDLIDYLKQSFDIKYQIQFKISSDPVELDVSQAVPIGLILNEAITNAVKYAFPENKQDATITVSLELVGSDYIKLMVSDNGIGLPADFETGKKGSLGMILMKGLSREIKAEFLITSMNGAHISISFFLNRIQRDILHKKAI